SSDMRKQEPPMSRRYASTLNLPLRITARVMFSLLKRYEGALLAYEQAIRLDPGKAYGYNGNGNALQGLERYQEALLAYERAIHLNPHWVKAYNGKISALNNLKRYEEAKAVCERAISLLPSRKETYDWDLNELKRYQEALTTLGHVIRLDPHFAHDLADV